MGYTTTDNLIEALPDAASVDTVVLGRFIARASAMIDGAVGRSFPAAVTAEDRVFYGTGTHLLRIDWHEDALVTSVTMPTGWTAPSFTEIRDTANETCYLNITDSTGRLLRDDGRVYYPWSDAALPTWPDGLPVTVNAAWGYAATPGDIEDACIAICQANWRETYAQAGDVWQGTVGIDWQIPPRVRDALRDRKAWAQFGVTG